MATETDTPDGLEDRVEKLETGQTSIISKLDELLSVGGKAHAKAEEHEERHLDRPSTIEAMVQSELKKAEAEKAKAAEADAEKSERQTIKERLAQLTEAKPESPQPRRERWMWGPK